MMALTEAVLIHRRQLCAQYKHRLLAMLPVEWSYLANIPLDEPRVPSPRQQSAARKLVRLQLRVVQRIPDA